MIVDDIGPLLIAWEVIRVFGASFCVTHVTQQKDRDPDQALSILKRLARWKNEWYRETGAFTQYVVPMAVDATN
jgi:hypothetical protein